MKRLYLPLLLLLLSCCAATAQTVTVISPTGDGGFETGTTLAANGWNYVGHATINAWYVGGVAVSAGSRGCYVGQSVSDNNGGNGAPTTNHIYRDVTIPAGATNVQLSFKLRYTTSEPLWDRFCVSIYPTSVVPTTGSYGTAYPYTGTTGAVPPGVIAKLYENSNVYGSFVTVNSSTPAATYSTSGALLNLTPYAGTTFRLAFTFTNADQFGTAGNPAVDEISLTYDIPCTPPAAFTGSLSICQGTTSTLSSATPGGTWSTSSSSIASISPSGSSCVVTGTGGGTATISYIVSGCARTSVVTVTPVPGATVSAATPVYCTGGSSQLNGSVSLPPLVLSQDFNSGLGAWTINNISGNATSYFQIRTSPGYAGIAGDGTPMMQAAPDAITSTTSTNFVSPVFSLVGYTSATLTLNQYYFAYGADATVAIEYSTNGGSSWSTLVSILGTSTGTTTWSAATPTSTYTIPAAMIGQPNCRLRWNYVSTWGFYWAVDNIRVNGVSGPQGVVWSPTTDLYTNAALTIPYTGAATTSPVFASPTATTVPNYVTYTASFTLGSCTNSSGTTTLTVNPLPAAITGSAVVCATRTINLATTSTGGVWSSGNPAVATVSGSGSTGTVTGVSAGTALITYAFPTGCVATRVVTVLASPAPIGGTSYQLCEAGTITLTHPDGGTGTWLSVSPSVATIGLSSGIVNGISNGYTTVSYTNTNGCVVTRQVTVNPLPVVSMTPATTATVCLGNSATFTAASAAPQLLLMSQDFNSGLGSWAVTNGTGNAASWWQIVSGAGASGFSGDGTPYLQAAANAFLSGTTVSTVTSPSFSTTGGFATVNLSFNQYLFSFAPDAAASIEYSIDGGATWTEIVNQALSVITDAGDDGSWSASTPEYNVALPAAALGQNNVRIRFVYNAQSLYWLIDNISVKGVMPASTFAWTGAAGLSCSSCPAPTITPTTTGTSAYNLAVTSSAGCITNTAVTMTVNPNPSAISGSLTICEGVTGVLSSTAGGTWTSGSTANATVTSGGGAITGVAAGTADITYILSTTGCRTTAVATVLAAPAAISPASVGICIGDNATLSNTTSGGTWVSSNTAVANVSSTGVVSSVATGNTNITYTIPTGCIAIRSVTVNPLPAVITGASSVCVGATTPLGNTVILGTWSSSDISVATVNSTTGVVTGVAQGNVFISYTLPTGCFAIKSMQVNPLPLATTGASSVCTGLNTVLSNPSLGGVWSSSASGIAAVDASGIVTGGLAGNATISYTYPATGCSSLHPFTVNPLPAAITGLQKVCKDASVTFSDADAFGTWSSGDATIASVDASTGVISGITPGNTRITYTLPTGCVNSRSITVNPLPNTINGASAVCYGSTTNMTNTTPLGTWASSDPSVATISSGGLVSPVNAAGGVTTISYTVTNSGCYTTRDIAVNPLPSTIGGSTILCAGSNVILTNADAGGTWSSSNTGVFTISGTGDGTGVSAGNANVTYTLSTGCRRSTPVVVNALPSDIIGNETVCEGRQTTLINMSTGGNWSTANPTIATVSSSGNVTGVSPGATTITYMFGTGCYRTKTLTVNALPAPITGTFAICAGTTTTLSNADMGGTWVSSLPVVATVGILGNVVAGYNAGGTVITYTLPTGCFRTQTFIVNPLPNSLTGTASVCEGLTTALNSTTTGGTWSSEVVAIASVDDVTGVVTGVAQGAVNISYTLSTGCFRTRSVVVNPTPSSIGGPASACLGGNATLSATPVNGTWSSGSASVASISSAGVVTANAAGVTTMTYTLPAGCRTTTSFVVNPLPAAITGTRVLCNGATTTLANAVQVVTGAQVILQLQMSMP